jgi:hypothetical protein
MSRFSIRAGVCALLGTGAVVMLAVAGSAQAPTGLAGTWTLNSAKSKFSPGPAPKSMTITYTPSGDMMKIAVDVVTGDGAKQHWEMSAAYDGKEYPVTGNPDADMVSIKRVDDKTGVSTFKKAGKLMATNTRTLSADGKVLTITSKGVNGEGKPRNDVALYEKAK